MSGNSNFQGKYITPMQAARNLSRRAAFKRGYDDVMKDRAFDYSITIKIEEVDYARGRAFAVWSRVSNQPSCRWKNGVLSRAAEERLLRAICVRAII